MVGPRRVISYARPLCFSFLVVLVGAPALHAQSPEQIPPAARAEGFEQSAREFARKILALTGPRPSLVLSTQNLSSLSEIEAAWLHRALEAELNAKGARLVSAPPAGAEARVTLSENLQQLLWVAEVRWQESQDVVMVSFPRSTVARSGKPATLVQARKLLSLPDPILDFAASGPPDDSSSRLILLERTQVHLLLGSNRGWQPAGVRRFTSSGPVPRDARGRLIPSGDQFELHTPQQVCSVSEKPSLNVECREEDTGWPLDVIGPERAAASLARGRNYFDGSLRVAGETKTFPPFYSAARIVSADGSTGWILAGLNGKALLYGSDLKPLAEFTGWGSDLVSLATGCGSGRQVLATRMRDRTERDTIQAFEIIDRRAVRTGEPVDLPGPVTALWPAADGTTANAVVRNLETGEYDALSISISCTH